MSSSAFAVLELPHGVVPDPDEFIEAAMRWHFDAETGSKFWLERQSSLDFDPCRHVRTFADLSLFPTVTDELRDVPVEDLIPKGFGPRPDVMGVIESGGTTGPPKRLPMLREFAERLVAQDVGVLEAAGVDKDRNWLALMPGGPHAAFEHTRRSAHAYGVLLFGVDMDPRWVKKQLGAGSRAEAEAYAEHVVDQAEHVLRNQQVGFIRLTPPLLARMSRRDELVELIREKIRNIQWTSASMDPESCHFYRTELFPEARITGMYGTTMALGAGGSERLGLDDDAPCIIDPTLSPYVTFGVVDPETGETVEYGQQGQLVVNHVSKSFLLPNNRERDLATRIAPVAAEQVGDSIADISPMPEFGGTEVIEGVY